MAAKSARASSASFDTRLSAYIIDGLIMFFPTFPVFLWATFAAALDGVLWLLMLYAFAWHVYWVAFWSRLGGGQTPGMRLRRIRVIGEDGRDLSFGQALTRAVVLVFGSALGIVPVSVLLDRDGIGVHDRLARSRVIEVKPSGQT